MRIILASKSPRRREILEELGLEFEIITADCDESSDITDGGELVTSLATRKGRAVLEKLGEALEDTLIIACDTLVYASGEFLGKPKDFDDAYRMISLLSGGSHEVISGIYLYFNGKESGGFASTRVFFDNMSDDTIRNYIADGEPMDKAGAYAIQGLAGIYISKIEGDYSNVVGLPKNLLFKTLKEDFGLDVFDLKS